MKEISFATTARQFGSKSQTTLWVYILENVEFCH